MQPMISEILEKCSKIKSRNEQVQFLQAHGHNTTLKIILKFTFDPKIKFNLPKGDPPYKPCEWPGQEGRLYQEARKLHYYIEGIQPELPQLKRESMFISLLESLDPKEAKLVLAMKSKKSPYKGITKKLVEEAFGAM